MHCCCCCSAAKLCPTPCDNKDCVMPCSPVLQCLPESAQIHTHWVDDAIHPSHPLLPPPPFAFSLSQHQFLSQWVSSTSGSQGTGASASVLPVNGKGWFPLGLTGLISLQSEGLSRVFSNTTVQSISSSVLSLLYGSTLPFVPYYGKTIALTIQTFVGKVTLLFNMLSRFVIAFLPRNKCLLTSWLHLPSTVILEPKEIKSVTASTFPPSICHEVMASDTMILPFWTLSFKPTFSLSSLSQ